MGINLYGASTPLSGEFHLINDSKPVILFVSKSIWGWNKSKNS